MEVDRVDTTQSASLEASRASRSADLPDDRTRAAPEPATARASPARAEVSISREARTRSLERERFPEGSAASARAEPAEQRRIEPPESGGVDPLLAVRFGPAPLDRLVPDVESVTAEGLSQRARIRTVGAVLDPARGNEPKVVADRRDAARDSARDEAIRDPLTTTPGSEEDEKLEFPPLLGSERLAGEGPPMQRAQLPQFEQNLELRSMLERERAEEERERDEAIAAALGAAADSLAVRDDQRDEAPKLAPAAAPVSRPGGEPRAEVPTERTEPLGRAVAERTFTRAGAVAAQAADELVTRFLANTPVEDPGPEPRARIDRISERG